MERLSPGAEKTRFAIPIRDGVRAPLLEMAAVCREESPDTLILVDAVTSLGGSEFGFDDWGIDFAFARAASIEERGFLFDCLAARKALADGKTPATPNVPLVFALSRQLAASPRRRSRTVGHASGRWPMPLPNGRAPTGSSSSSLKPIGRGQ